MHIHDHCYYSYYTWYITTSFKSPVVKTTSDKSKAKAKKLVVNADFLDQVKTKTTIFARSTKLVQLKKEDEENTTRLEGIIIHVIFNVIITILIRLGI